MYIVQRVWILYAQNTDTYDIYQNSAAYNNRALLQSTEYKLLYSNMQSTRCSNELSYPVGQK